MSLDDIATVNVTTTGAGVTRAGYGVPLILSYNAAPFAGARTLSYTSLSAVSDDWSANSPEYLAAAAIFSQSPRPKKILIGRGDFPATQRFAIGVQASGLSNLYKVRVALATGVAWVSQDAEYNSGNGATGWSPSNTWSSGDVVIADGSKIYACLGKSGATGMGGGLGGGFTGIGAASGPSGIGAAIQEGQIWWMFTGTGSTGSITSDAVIQGVRTKIEALTAPAPVGVGAGQLISSLQGSAGARTLRLLANASNKFFGLQVYDRSLLNISQDHADPGVATDLGTIDNADSSWYGLVTLYNSEALIEAAQGWVESNTKLYPAASLDSQIARVAESPSATDVAHDTKASAYARSWVMHHPSNDEFMDAAELGRWFPVSPGGETWRMKTLSGVTVESYTSTEITNMKAKYAHFYYDVGGVNVVGGDAKTGANEYIDVTRFIDWYTSELQAGLADLIIQSEKVPFTNLGIDKVEAKVRQMNLRGIRAGGISPDPEPVVTAPDVSDVSSSDKAARELTGVETQWTLAGAIHHITVSVTAST